MLIQKLRLKRGWSQQQLAQASGLSARTIQRIEAGQPASVETLKSIASVFEVDFSTLNTEEAEMDTTMTAAEEAEREAFAHVRALRGFYVACLRYALIAVALYAINLLTSPQRMWSYWAMLGLGLALAAHAIRVFAPYRLFGPQWEKRQVEKRLGRPL
ncbi:helix-turn-helix domain-containing protein [Achromobacter anxifer]|jgi:transcriptional regulator with XRE-family HTH domain|uniref:HTH cro/C1-type domain-containing protein n=1 Tax=Achromobacter anxifer TaxID=1287737 RepID=A0A6S7EIV7_9BURK|nr:helix-turn-helix domain-containing protein [Achromobacter anxifer]MDF8359747.1 helix-turn-helix domain-containing protein [Achromobacter anxifer]CAB3911020.1 hypothetical protein LMG26858_04735 [Achromobacter anxifer]